MTWQCDTRHPHKQTIGYGQYLGAKDEFKVLGGYLVWAGVNQQPLVHQFRMKSFKPYWG
jgi:hypothetical protein